MAATAGSSPNLNRESLPGGPASAYDNGHMSLSSDPTTNRGNPPPSPRAATLAALASGINRLEAPPRGEPIEAIIHKKILAEEPVLQVEDFSLWYGTKQALFDVSMLIPKGEGDGHHRPVGLRQIDAAAVREPHERSDRRRYDARRHESRGRFDLCQGVDVIELRKRMGMVFQKPNPFPMSIFENVIYPLRIDGERNKRAHQGRRRTEPPRRGPVGRGRQPPPRKPPPASPAGSSVRCASPGPLPASRTCSCSMNLAPRWTRWRPTRLRS